MSDNDKRKQALIEAAQIAIDMTEFYQHSPVALGALNDLQKIFLEMAEANVKEDQKRDSFDEENFFKPLDEVVDNSIE